LPHALTLDLHYDYTDNVLLAGTLGRGAWTLSNPFSSGGSLLATSVSRQASAGSLDLLRTPTLPAQAPSDGQAAGIDTSGPGKPPPPLRKHQRGVAGRASGPGRRAGRQRGRRGRVPPDPETGGVPHAGPAG